MYDLPFCLQWAYPKATLPASFLNRSLVDFKKALDTICDPVLETGLLHHSSLLAMGLLSRHVFRAGLPADDPNHLDSPLTRSHITAFKTKFTAVKKRVHDGPAAKLLDEYDLPAHTMDKSGICWPDVLPLRAGDEGSPAMAAQERKRAREFVTGLSDLPTYVDICNSPDMKWVSPFVKMPLHTLIMPCRPRSRKWVGLRAFRPFSRGSGHHTTAAASHHRSSGRRSCQIC